MNTDNLKNLSSKPVSRRSFLRSGAAVAVAGIVPRHVLGGPGHTPPSEQLNIGFIGAGGRAEGNLRNLKSEHFAAFCDVDEKQAAETFQIYPDAKKYKDFRVMLDTERDLDAAVVSTPDHTHAVATVAALKKGLHVYCEKPLTHTVYEARQVCLAAKASGKATQMGNQMMASEGHRLVCEWIWDGAIGDVQEVRAWTDRPSLSGERAMWRQGVDRPGEKPDVPGTLDWDLWLGPAPYRPYHRFYVPFAWRGWWDFGTGAMGDMGIHNIAPAFSALKLGAPSSVSASCTPTNYDSYPVATTVDYEFPARGSMPPVSLHWCDGGLLPERPKDLEDGRQLVREDGGVIFIGTEGTLYAQGEGGAHPRLIPETKMRAYKQPAKTLPRSIGHQQEWAQACKEGTPTGSNFDFAGPYTEAILLGVVALRFPGKKLIWDSQTLSFTNCPEANQYLHYAYRSGWSL